jgi:magnesium-dependent phosphatase 1
MSASSIHLENEFDAPPKLLVFDLDGCVWWPELYMMSGAPYKRDRSSHPCNAKDRAGEKIAPFAGARQIFEAIHAARTRGDSNSWSNVKVAVASRTHYARWAEQCLKLMTLEDGTTLDEFFDGGEVYPGDKKTHLSRLRKQFDISDPADIVFYDNERRNCISVAEIGIRTVYTPDGLTYKLFKRGLVKKSR